MEGINRVPVELVKIIPIFEGDARELPLFLKKCQYILENFGGNDAQNQYLFHVVTSRLAGEASKLVGERDQISTWSELKSLLSQHFGDPRTEECLVMELESVKIHRGESYEDFCHRVQQLRSILFAKLNETIKDANERLIRQHIYNNTSFNVFLYNLPAYFVRLVRLRNVKTLEDALKVVLEEQNFQTVYDYKNQSRNSNHNNKNQRTSPINNMNSNPFRPNNSQRQFQPSVPSTSTNNFFPANNNNGAKFNSNNSFQMRNLRQQPSSMNFRNSNQWQQYNRPNVSYNQHASGNAPRFASPVGSGSNTDVTMRTASSRRINYTNNDNLCNQPSTEAHSGDVGFNYDSAEDSNENLDRVENFLITASSIGKK